VERPPEPGDRRRAGSHGPTLERPPGERYRAPDQAGATPRRSTPLAIGLGVLAGLAGSAAIVVLGGVFSLSAGLLVVAAAIGWGIGRIVRGTASATTEARRRSVIAAALAVDSVILGQVGLWLYSLVQGGALGPLDYLSQARGPLVIAEVALAAVLAWAFAR
jgi:hypothetical protein